MRLDGEHRVEAPPQPVADHALRDGLAWCEDRVLSHVGEVRRDERHAPRAGAAQRVGREHGLDQLRVGVVEGAHDDGVVGGWGVDTDETLAVGKAMHRDAIAADAQMACQRAAEGGAVCEGVDVETYSRRHGHWVPR